MLINASITMKIFRTRISADKRGFVFTRDNPRLSASYLPISGFSTSVTFLLGCPILRSTTRVSQQGLEQVGKLKREHKLGRCTLP